MNRRTLLGTLAGPVLPISLRAALAQERWSDLREVNPPREPSPESLVAIVGCDLFDGRGGAVITNAAVVVRGSRVEASGRRRDIAIPEGASVVEASGMTLMPGMIDSHFHIGQNIGPERPSTLLSGGVTSFRDPGRPFEVWEFLHQADKPMPRAFLTGNHFDNDPPAYPHNAVVVTSPEDTRATVERYVSQGASGIKIYYRFPLELIRTACESADRHGVPVMAHLELIRADDAIRAGLDGVEHITSFGTSLAEPESESAFVETVAAYNRNRREARYEMWSRFDFDTNTRLDRLIELLLKERVIVSPTLFTFEFRETDDGVTRAQVEGFKNMMRLTGILHRAGVPIVVGSHGRPPNAFARELEILVESGLTPVEVLVSATQNGARFFGTQDRLGTIERGKLADLILVNGDPTKDISRIRDVERIMLNGEWV